MTKENELRLVGKGSRRLTRMTVSRVVIKICLRECKLKVVIQKNHGEKLNVLVNDRVQEDFYEHDVIARFKNASDMFKFLQGYHTCFKNLSK